MTPQDDRSSGAVRFNAVDVFAAIVILGLMPLGYGAYLLFRTPPPTLAKVSPARLIVGADQRVEIEGTNFRPFLRVSFDATPAKSFLIGSTTYADVDVPTLKPGVYDVVLYDYSQEVARLPKALTVVPPAADVELEVIGSFKSLPDAPAAPVRVGDRFPPGSGAIAEVIAVGAPAPGDMRLRVGDDTIRVPVGGREWPATLRVKCYTARRPDGTVQCLLPGADGPTVVAPDVLLTLPSPPNSFEFQIATVRAPAGAAGSSQIR